MSVDLSTQYLGLRLKNPLVVAASPLTTQLHMLERLEQAGAAAAVMSSLFEEQIRHEASDVGEHGLAAAEGYVEPLAVVSRDLDEYNAGADSYLRRIEAAKKAVSIPLIGSLNGAHRGGWTRFARLIQDAGADALELNIYFVPTEPTITGSQVEDEYVALLSEIRSQVSIPLAVKLGPYFSSLPNMARRLVEAGADGLVLFNRFLQPDIDLETLAVAPRLVPSSRDELRLPLRWIAILRDQLSASLAGTSGVHFAEDVLKLLLAGADVVMLASVLIHRGPGILTTLLAEVAHWLEGRGYQSVAQIKGLASQRRCSCSTAYERANYAKALASFTPRTMA